MKTRDFTDNLNIDPRFIGLEALLIPYLANTSSQRGSMFASNITQALIVNGCEPPMTMTSYEYVVGKYEFNNTKRNQDIEILAVVPKFKVNVGSHQIQSNPSLTVVYVGIDDNKVSYFNLDTYTKLSDHFGYMNTWSPNVHNIKLHSYIPKEMEFVTSPAHKDNMYCLGVNANVVNLTLPEVTEDAFVISRSFAEKLTHPAVDSTTISISVDQVPINKFGAEDDYKFCPDIGECVGDDGILMALRQIDDDAFIANMTEEALSNIEYLHDDIYTAPPGAIITDIQVYTSKAVRKLKNNNNVYSQALKYQEQHYTYYRTILDAYKTIKSLGYSIDEKFNTLVTRCMGMVPSKSNKIDLMNKRDPVDFINIEITWMYDRKVASGAKLTGRYGDKGVGAIWEDEDMPVDEYGFRADMIKSPESIPNRMNIGQIYEQALNRSSEVLRRRAMAGELGSNQEAYDYILGYVGMINPNQVELMVEAKNKLGVDQALQAIIDSYLFLIVPPTLNTITEELVLEIYEKYNIPTSKVKFNRVLSDGTKQTIVTDSDEIVIGSEYIYLLGKIPRYQMSSIEMGYVSQFQIPHKISDKNTKNQYPFGQTPIRLGEDETSLLTMTLGSEVVSRFMGLNANSPKAVMKLQEDLLTSKSPSKLKQVDMTTEEIIKNNNVINLFNHQLGACGIVAGTRKIGE